MPGTTSRKPPKDPEEHLLDTDDEQLQLLEGYKTTALGKIWHRARDLVFQRNRGKYKRKLKDREGEIGQKVSIVRLDLIAQSRLDAYRKSKEKISYRPLRQVVCSGECYICPFGQDDLNEEWHCTLPKSRVRMVSPNTKKVKNRKLKEEK